MLVTNFVYVCQTSNHRGASLCEKSGDKPVQLSFFRLVYLELNPFLSVNPVNKQRVYVGKTESHLGTISASLEKLLENKLVVPR